MKCCDPAPKMIFNLTFYRRPAQTIVVQRNKIRRNQAVELKNVVNQLNCVQATSVFCILPSQCNAGNPILHNCIFDNPKVNLFFRQSNRPTKFINIHSGGQS